MKSLLSGKIEAVPLHLVDFADTTFAITPVWLARDELTVSIRNAGILAPLVLEGKPDGTFSIINGRRRAEAAARLGLAEVPALVLPPGQQGSRFIEAVYDHAASRPLHDVEKAQALVKLQSDCGLQPERLIREFLPLLGIRANRFYLQKYLQLGRLPEPLQRAVGTGLELDIALALDAWPSADQDFFLSLVDRYQPGASRLRQFFRLLDDLTALRPETEGETQARLESIWVESGAAQLEASPEPASAARFQEILEVLRRLRFPRLCEHEKRFARLKSSLKIPPGLNLQAPPHFEGDRLQVSFSIANPAELGLLADRLQAISKEPALEEMFQLL